VSVLRDLAGQPEGAIVIFQDLTHVVEMEEQLRRGERLSAVGQLAAGLAHEIRNPLASLSGAIELLAVDLPQGDASSRTLRDIVQRETARLNRLVSDFLTYARPGSAAPSRAAALSSGAARAGGARRRERRRRDDRRARGTARARQPRPAPPGVLNLL
jgi:nitrogen-specific signal transduction histidine kinase